MSHFYESLHPDDVPPSHQGDPIWPDDDSETDEEGEDDANERTD